jgi:hypothetical protein
MRKQRGQKTKKFMVYFMAFIMVGSVFGIIFFGFSSGNASTLSYNDFEFVNRGSFWSTSIDGREALFTYFPSDVELIEVDAGAVERLRNKVQLDVTSDFNDTFAEGIALANYQMGITLNNFNIFIRNGFTKEQQNFPVITCNQSTIYVPVILFRSGNETKILLENNCIVAQSAVHADAIRLKDRLVYGMLGIMQ